MFVSLDFALSCLGLEIKVLYFLTSARITAILEARCSNILWSSWSLVDISLYLELFGADPGLSVLQGDLGVTYFETCSFP